MTDHAADGAADGAAAPPRAAPRIADWHFDPVSPYAYLQFLQMDQLPADVEVRFRPTLFAGLLNHWGQLGPAEIPAKKIATFQLCRWRAGKMGVPFAPPPRHPFNPLALLRLCIALGETREAAGAVLTHVWGEGRDGQAEEAIDALAARLGAPDWREMVSRRDVKDRLRANVDEATAKGVFGVPSFVIEGRVFWGDDMFGLMLDWLEDPAAMDEAEWRAAEAMPVAAVRPRPGL